MIGSHNLGTTKDKYAGIPHDELALKTEGNQTLKPCSHLTSVFAFFFDFCC